MKVKELIALLGTMNPDATIKSEYPLDADGKSWESTENVLVVDVEGDEVCVIANNIPDLDDLDIED